MSIFPRTRRVKFSQNHGPMREKSQSTYPRRKGDNSSTSFNDPIAQYRRPRRGPNYLPKTRKCGLQAQVQTQKVRSGRLHLMRHPRMIKKGRSTDMGYEVYGISAARRLFFHTFAQFWGLFIGCSGRCRSSATGGVTLCDSEARSGCDARKRRASRNNFFKRCAPARQASTDQGEVELQNLRAKGARSAEKMRDSKASKERSFLGLPERVAKLLDSLKPVEFHLQQPKKSYHMGEHPTYSYSRTVGRRPRQIRR